MSAWSMAGPLIRDSMPAFRLDTTRISEHSLSPLQTMDNCCSDLADRTQLLTLKCPSFGDWLPPLRELLAKSGPLLRSHQWLVDTGDAHGSYTSTPGVFFQTPWSVGWGFCWESSNVWFPANPASFLSLCSWNWSPYVINFLCAQLLASCGQSTWESVLERAVREPGDSECKVAESK